MVLMAVAEVIMDEKSGSVLLLLLGRDQESLAMAIGVSEATAIAKELQQIELPRPMTHDLMRDMLAVLRVGLVRIEVLELRDSTYFAEIVLRTADGAEIRVDSRPSDAIALALRSEAPIYASEQILRKEESSAQEFPPATDKESWKRILEEMDPEDFGKYKM